MSGDISTQSSNLDKIILRNIIVVVVAAHEATEWRWYPFAFDTRGASNQASQIATENLYVTCIIDF